MSIVGSRKRNDSEAFKREEKERERVAAFTEPPSESDAFTARYVLFSGPVIANGSLSLSLSLSQRVITRNANHSVRRGVGVLA